jgi:hypothetical protein
MPTIDWTDPDCQVTDHFTVRDCLWLHGSYNRLATEDDGVDLDKMLTLCQVLEQVREILGCAMNVHCMFRSQAYNQSQGIHPAADVHSMSEACDFDCGSALTIQEVKDKLEPVLGKLGIRMEKGTTTWVHVDLHKVGPSGRYFTV